MKEIRTEIIITATPRAVWEMLTDFPSYPKWNPFIRSAGGRVQEGERLKVFLQPPGGRGTNFRPRVLAAEPGRQLRWLGHLGIPGLFDGEHIFEIEQLDPGRVKFTQRERFSGLLIPLLWRKLDRGTRQGFENMNRALKERAEGRVR